MLAKTTASVYYNDSLIWPMDQNTPRVFQVLLLNNKIHGYDIMIPNIIESKYKKYIMPDII